jgi:hypothetical protein
VQPAYGVTVQQVDNRYAYRFDVEKKPDTSLAPRAQFSIARGEQVTVGYWLVNDHGFDVKVYLDLPEVPSTTAGVTDVLDESVFHARVLTWRDVIELNDLEPTDPRWVDMNGNGTLDRADWERLYPNVISTVDTTVVRSFESPGESVTGDIVLQRDPDPLPLYRAEGIVNTPIEIPQGESRLLWMVITVPDDQQTGRYESKTGGNSSLQFFTYKTASGALADNQRLEFDIWVPCWDALDDAENDLNLWNYSYQPGPLRTEVGGILNNAFTEGRARIRQEMDHNTLYVPIGFPSRTDPDNPNLVQVFDWIVAGMVADLNRHETYGERPRTIVLSISRHEVLFDADWGPDPTTPTVRWTRRLEKLFIDFEDRAIARGLVINDYEWVVSLVDEPTPFPVFDRAVWPAAPLTAAACTDAGIDAAVPNSTINIDIERVGFGLTCTSEPRCWAQHLVPMRDATGTVGVRVSRTTLFRHAANVVRNLPATMKLQPKILVNHHPPDSNYCDFLVSDYEDSTSTRDGVDIWMQASWMSDDMPLAHPFNNGTQPDFADEFWWYQFGSQLGAMRYLQAGLRTPYTGFSGQAAWSFWAAHAWASNGEKYLADADPNTPAFDHPPYAVHSWVRTQPALWSQETSMYLSDHATLGNYLPVPDPTAHDTPNGELLIPGRVLFASRQALELDRTLRLVHRGEPSGNGYTPLPNGAASTLETLSIQASRSCHQDDDCTNGEATPDDVMDLTHQWLDRAYEQDASCPTAPAYEYLGTDPELKDAWEVNPWQ